MPRPTYPRRIYLDTFLDDFKRYGGWTPKVLRLASRAIVPAPIPGSGHILNGQFDPELIGDEVHAAIAEQMKRVRQARVTIVTPALLELVMETAHGIIQRCVKRNVLTQFALDPLPSTPQWIEFQPPYLGDHAFAIHALWFDSATALYGSDRFSRELEMHSITWPVPGNTVVMQLIESPWEHKSMHLYPDGSHSILQTGTCDNPTCAIARTTVEGKGYALHSVHDRARADAVLQQGGVCACYFDAWCWSVILYVLFAYLRLEQAQGPDAITTVPYQVDVPHMKRKAQDREGIEREVADWNAVRPPVYRIVNVVNPKQRLARIARHQDTRTGLPVVDVETSRYADQERYEAIEHMLEPFPRFLVAGPGLPWTKTQVIMVHPKQPRRYYRRRDSAGSVRIIAEP